jgi:hypothetical protein
MGAGCVVGPDADGKAVPGIVRNLDGFYFSLEFNNAQHRPKDFRLRNHHFIVNFKHGGAMK